MQDAPAEFFAVTWDPADFVNIDISIGDSSAQTFLEVLVLILAVDLWADPRSPCPFLGDNTAALQEAVGLRGKGQLALPAQVLAVLRCRRSLEIPVAHLANEANTLADALSRLEAPEGNRKAFPAVLANVKRRIPCELSCIWKMVEPPANRR